MMNIEKREFINRTTLVNENEKMVNSFNGYTQMEINNIKSNKIKIAQNSKDIIEFVNDSKKTHGNFKIYLGKVEENIANHIKISSE